MELSPELKHYRQLIERELRLRLPAATMRPSLIHQAMRYSVFAGGKRVRPLLTVAAATFLGLPAAKALAAAAAIECLHTYTLIHDDLPAMDNDDLRRGVPTNHRVYGEAIAILAGDALLTLAFELLVQVKPRAPYTALDIVREVARAAGSRGVVGGQAVDIQLEGKKALAQHVVYIHKHKTAALITAALITGGLLAGANRRTIKLFKKLGSTLGQEFQMVDDILNETSDRKTLGKAVKSDVQRKKATALAVWGLKKSRERREELSAQTKRVLKQLNADGSPLADLIQAIQTRHH